MRERVANADLGIAEADFAIASTGTLAVVSNGDRPSAITLLPPATLAIVQIDRVMANLAAVLAELGPKRGRGESFDVDHRPQPDRGYRETNRARRAWSQVDSRSRGVAPR